MSDISRPVRTHTTAETSLQSLLHCPILMLFFEVYGIECQDIPDPPGYISESSNASVWGKRALGDSSGKNEGRWANRKVIDCGLRVSL